MKQNIGTAFFIFTFFVSIISGGRAFADVTVIWTKGDGTPFRIAYKNETNFRVNSAIDNYFVVKNGKLYNVRKKDKSWEVVDVEALQAKLESSGIGDLLEKYRKKSDSAKAAETITLKSLGRKEKVAGVNGEVYSISQNNGAGEAKAEVTEGVLTRDSRVTTAWFAWMSTIVRSMERLDNTVKYNLKPSATSILYHSFEKIGVAPVSVKGGLQLLSIDESPVSAKEFKLPAKPIKLPEKIESAGGGAIPFGLPGVSSGAPVGGVAPAMPGRGVSSSAPLNEEPTVKPEKVKPTVKPEKVKPAVKPEKVKPVMKKKSPAVVKPKAKPKKKVSEKPKETDESLWDTLGGDGEKP